MDIDLPARNLTLNAGMFSPSVTVGFRHLVLALGGIVDLSRVPGMPEHAFLMKSIGDAQELRGAVIDRLEEANLQRDEAAIKRLLTFVVVGGGYSGVETAGQILDLIQGINRFYPRIARPDYRVILIHSGAHLLPEISEDLGRYCEKNMIAPRRRDHPQRPRHLDDRQQGDPRRRPRPREPHGRLDRRQRAATPSSSTSARRNNIPTEKARIITDATMRVQGFDNLWAAGDCAAVPMAAAKEPPAEADGRSAMPGSPLRRRNIVRPTAQFAYRQGIVPREKSGQYPQGRRSHPPRPFTFKG